MWWNLPKRYFEKTGKIQERARRADIGWQESIAEHHVTIAALASSRLIHWEVLFISKRGTSLHFPTKQLAEEMNQVQAYLSPGECRVTTNGEGKGLLHNSANLCESCLIENSCSLCLLLHALCLGSGKCHCTLTRDYQYKTMVYL